METLGRKVQKTETMKIIKKNKAVAPASHFPSFPLRLGSVGQQDAVLYLLQEL